MNGVRAERFNSILDIPAGQWDSLVSLHDIQNSHAWLRAIEAAHINGWRSRYWLFYNGSRLVAHASAALVDFNLDLWAQGGLKRLIRTVRRLFPGFLHIRMLECGHPTALGNTLVDSGAIPRQVLLSLLDSELIALAREEGIRLMMMRDASAAEQPGFAPLLQRGYRPVPNMTNTLLPIPWKRFQEYQDDLTSKRRHEVHHRFEQFYSHGGSIERLYDYTALASQMETLWEATVAQATEYQRERLSAAYFAAMSQHLGDRSFAIVCRRYGEVVGFVQLVVSGETLISTYCGLDYRCNRSLFTYFVLYYASIQAAIELGSRWLELGVTNYTPKIEQGALPQSLRMYAKSTNPFLNALAAHFLRLTAAEPPFPDRHILNRRYFDRVRMPHSPPIRVRGQLFRLMRATADTLQLGGPARRLSGNIKVYIDDAEGIPFYLRVRITRRSDSCLSGNVIDRSSTARFLWHRMILRLPMEMIHES